MKRVVAVVLLVVVLTIPIFAADVEYVPYDANEFPLWSIKLRRAETLAFGSLPITFALVNLSYGAATSLGAPSISADGMQESLTLLAVAGTLSLVVAIADYIIGEMQN